MNSDKSQGTTDQQANWNQLMSVRAALRARTGLDPFLSEPIPFAWAQARQEVDDLRDELGVEKKPIDDRHPCPDCGKKTRREYGLCKQCVLGHAVLIEADSPEGYRHRIRLAKYNITRLEYTQLYMFQRGACAICHEILTPSETHVDHDHETGNVRGLLCRLCNAGLGFFKDNRSALRRAGEYLRKSPLAKTKAKPWSPPQMRRAKRSVRWQHNRTH